MSLTRRRHTGGRRYPLLGVNRPRSANRSSAQPRHSQSPQPIPTHYVTPSRPNPSPPTTSPPGSTRGPTRSLRRAGSSSGWPGQARPWRRRDLGTQVPQHHPATPSCFDKLTTKAADERRSASPKSGTLWVLHGEPVEPRRTGTQRSLGHARSLPTHGVIPGLDPGTQRSVQSMRKVRLGGRVKPGHDGGGIWAHSFAASSRHHGRPPTHPQTPKPATA